MHEWLRSVLGSDDDVRRAPALIDLAESVLFDDDAAEVKRKANAWAQRQRDEIERAEDRAQYDASAKRLADHCREYGAWMPGDDL